jgi:hypothetical protein
MRFAVTLVIALVISIRAEAGRGAALVKYLPDDTNLVLVGDVAKSRSSAIFKKAFKIAREQNSAVDALATSIELDKAVDTVVIGVSANKAAVAVVEGRIDKLLAEAKKTATKSDTHEGVTFWITSDGEIAVVDKKLVFTSPGAMAGVIDRAKDKKAKGPSTVRTLLAATIATSGVVGGVVLDSAQRSELGKQLGAEPQWGTFSFGLTTKLAIEARLRFANDTGAATAVKTISDQLTPEKRGQLEGFVGKEFSDSIAIQQQQAFARLTATLTADELDKIIGLVKMFM